MNINQISVFREIMTTGSLSQAARNLHRTQPAVSATLKSLEDELQMPLFAREGRRLIPTPEAHYLFAEAIDILDRLQTTEQNMTLMRDRMTGSLRLVAMPGPSAYLLPTFISRFIQSRPHVNITLTTRSSPQVRKLMAAQSFDIGLCDIGSDIGRNNLYHSDIMPCHCVCAVPADDPLAHKDFIQPSDLSGKPMGILQPEHSTHIQTRQAFKDQNADLIIRFDMQYFLPLFHFIEAGQAYAVVDILSAESYLRQSGSNSRIIFRPFRPYVPMSYSLLSPCHRPLSALAQEFLYEWRTEMEMILKKHQNI